MSCYGCSRAYGIFCKEHGCPNCGYSYCSKCLKRPIAVPRHNGKVLNVCLICYDKLSKLQANAEAEKVIDCEALAGELVTKMRLIKNSTATTGPEAADALFDDVPPTEDLGAVMLPTSSTAQAGAHESVAGVQTANAQDIEENLDSVINKRLQNLKAVETTDEEIRARLSNLSGMPHQKNYDKKDLLLSTDNRTDQDKVKDLLKQFLGECDLDQRVETDRDNAISDIEKRLRVLRDTPLDGSEDGARAADINSAETNTPSDNEEENDETYLNNIVKKHLAELLVQAEAGPSALQQDAATNSSNDNNEELPWCNVCNEDCVYRCLGCEGELFCAQCYREIHDDEEYRNHVKVNYTGANKLKDNHF